MLSVASYCSKASTTYLFCFNLTRVNLLSVPCFFFFVGCYFKIFKSLILRETDQCNSIFGVLKAFVVV